MLGMLLQENHAQATCCSLIFLRVFLRSELGDH